MIVASVAELRRTRRVANVITEGYAAAGDGGHGSWRWSADSTATDNNGTVVKPDGWTGQGRYLRLYDGEINARWFGATGNGTTDDAPTIQDALDVALSLGLPLYIPAGSYKLSTYSTTGSPAAYQSRAAIYVDNTSHTTEAVIYGDGPRTRLYWPGGSRFKKDGITALPVSFDNQYQYFTDSAYAAITMSFAPIIVKGSNVTIRDLLIYGDNGTSTGTNYKQSENYQWAAISVYWESGLAVGSYGNLKVTGCEFRNIFGFSANDTAGICYDWTWSRNKHYYCGNGVNLDGDRFEANDNVFVSAEGFELSGGYGKVCRNYLSGETSIISLSGNGDVHSRGVTVADNVIDCISNISTSGGTIGIFIGGYFDVTCRGNIVKDAVTIGINVGLSNGGSVPSERIKVSDNNVLFTRTSGGVGTVVGIQVSAGIDCVFSGNTIKGSVSVSYGLELISCPRPTVVGNNISGVAGSGLMLVSGGLVNAVVSGNVLTGNTTFGMEIQTAASVLVSGNAIVGNTSADMRVFAVASGVSDVRLHNNKIGTRNVTAVSPITVDVDSGP